LLLSAADVSDIRPAVFYLPEMKGSFTMSGRIFDFEGKPPTHESEQPTETQSSVGDSSAAQEPESPSELNSLESRGEEQPFEAQITTSTEQSGSSHEARAPTFVPVRAPNANGPGKVADVLGRLIWGVTLLLALFSLLNFVLTRYTAREINAPQLAALAAECLAIAAVPYVFARAWDEVFRPWRH
jgi:hypothetical protein